ncbi:hypothetical protein Hdeb2414_s0005g00161171 [Helianthus debilis subsp. tardiflorus]
MYMCLKIDVHFVISSSSSSSSSWFLELSYMVERLKFLQIVIFSNASIDSSLAKSGNNP